MFKCQDLRYYVRGLSKNLYRGVFELFTIIFNKSSVFMSIIESIREMLSNVSLDSQIIYNPNARHLFSNNRREYSKYAYKCVEDSKLEIDKGEIHFS